MLAARCARSYPGHGGVGYVANMTAPRIQQLEAFPLADAAKFEKFDRDFQTGATYVQVSKAPVGYTLEIVEDGEAFMADYDPSGIVRGLEFLGGRRHALEYYCALAQQRSKGPGRRGPPPAVLA